MEQHKPTVIGNTPSLKKGPTVIPSTPVVNTPAGVTEKVSTSPKPTAIPSSSPLQPSVQKPTVPRVVSTPSAIPGSIRKRIPITREALQSKYQSARARIIEEALKLILTTNQEELTTGTVITWGQNLQEERNRLVEEALNYARSEVMQTVSGYLNRMFVILENIKLEKVFEKGPGVLSSVFRKATGEIDTPDELDNALREITQLSGLMQNKLQDLLVLREKFDTNSKNQDALADNLEAVIMAALVIAEYFGTQEDLQKELAIRFSERADNLTLTLGQTRSDSPVRKIHTEQPMKVISLVQDVVFNTLPTWITNVTSMRMQLNGKTKPNPTEIGELSRSLNTIIEKQK